MSGFHVIVGEDEYVVSQAAKKLIGDGAGLEVIDSLQSENADQQLRDIAAADESFSTPPFLDPSKTTWWKNVGFLPHGGAKGPSEAVKDALAAFAEKVARSPLPDNQKFVLSGPALLATSSFAKTIKKAAQMTVFPPQKPWAKAEAAVSVAMDAAAKAGLKFDKDAAEAFVSRVGTDARSIHSEIEKMRDYLGPKEKTITKVAVADISSQGAGVEPDVFAVADALGERNARKLQAALSVLEGDSGFAVVATTVAERLLRTLVELKDATLRGCLDKAVASMNAWQAKKAQRFLPFWSLAELRAARARVVAMRERAVTSSKSAGPLVVVGLLRLCRRPAAKGGA